MDKVVVETAKKIAKQTKSVGTIVLCFDHRGVMQGASYGSNRHNCDEMGKTMESFFVRYEQGDTFRPIFKEGSRSPFPK